jgi:hypothetical protein
MTDRRRSPERLVTLAAPRKGERYWLLNIFRYPAGRLIRLYDVHDADGAVVAANTELGVELDWSPTGSGFTATNPEKVSCLQ